MMSNSFRLIDLVVQEKKMKMLKIYGQTDDVRQAIRKAYLNFQLSALYVRANKPEGIIIMYLGYKL